MPELPEVETIVNGLREVLVGREILDVKINQPKMWLGAKPETVIHQKITGIKRLAKMILVQLSHHQTMIMHLKLTGQLIFTDAAGETVAGGHPDDQMVARQPSRFTHIIFSLSKDAHLYFNDQRQFGYVKLINDNELQLQPAVKEVGPDPFSDQFTAEYLYQHLQKRKSVTVKQVIMDQRTVGGIGNIYADESLFAAKILPARRANSISAAEAHTLYEAIISTLKKGIKYGGTSFRDYVDHQGHKGTMQEHLLVYGRNGQPCLVCGTPIKRTVVGGRGTHYCPNCQK